MRSAPVSAGLEHMAEIVKSNAIQPPSEIDISHGQAREGIPVATWRLTPDVKASNE